jgi:uncharacterized protein (DUF1499 family)
LVVSLNGVVAFYPPSPLHCRKLFFVNDISTDTANPPAYVALLPLGPGSADYAGEQLAAQQKALYPEIKTLTFRKPYYNVVNAACTLVIINGWRWVEANPIEGRIEAVAVRRWLRLRDDIVMRVRPGTTPGTTVFDIRSKSRFGLLDFGTNAARVRRFLTAMKDRLR